MSNIETFENMDEVITEVVIKALADIQTKKELKKDLVRMIGLVSKQYKNDSEFEKMLDKYCEIHK